MVAHLVLARRDQGHRSGGGLDLLASGHDTHGEGVDGRHENHE
ncbi:MAG: hypothetical protein ACYS3S_20805 [Planctomycetota bacterium]